MQTETETRLTRACLPEGPAREDLPHGREPLLTPSLWSWGCWGSGLLGFSVSQPAVASEDWSGECWGSACPSCSSFPFQEPQR